LYFPYIDIGISIKIEGWRGESNKVEFSSKTKILSKENEDEATHCRWRRCFIMFAGKNYGAKTKIVHSTNTIDKKMQFDRSFRMRGFSA
jgi:hypothetical protein